MLVDRNPDHPLRVVVADPSPMVRSALCADLEDHGVKVVGQAADGPTAVALTVARRPDVLCLDLRLPQLTGLDVARRVAAEAPDCHLLVLSETADENDVVDMLLAGVCGYLVKTASVERIVDAVRAAGAGDVVMSEQAVATLCERLRTLTRSAADLEAVGSLSERERDVLRLVADGKDNAAIADALVISTKTAKRHVSNILAKLDVENRVQAAVKAVAAGVI